MTPLRTIQQSLKLMGNRFQFTAVTDSEESGQDAIAIAAGEVRRIEALLTTFSEASETAEINRNAGIRPVRVSTETFNLISRSIRISIVTQGAFDITYGSVDTRLWNFDVSMSTLPDPETAREKVRLINYRNIILDKEHLSVMLKEKGMRIGFGGIGKGYAAERAKEVMIALGIRNGIVNASGDLVCWGKQASGKPWTIGIAHPDSKLEIFSTVDISNMAIATSGNYEKFVIIGGKKYSHTIDPRNGLPVSGIKSVTTISPNAEIADAMATPVTIMGVKAGLHMVNQISGLEAIIVDDENNVHKSDNIFFN